MSREPNESNDGDLPDTLYCARFVIANDKTPNEPPMILIYRRLKETDPARFLELLVKMEGDWLAYKGSRMQARYRARLESPAMDD